MAPPGTLYLGAIRRLDGGGSPAPLYLPAHHLVTHGVVVGMTGSGKTGLVTVLAEEALRSGVPVLVLDVKGDLPNLLLRFPSFSPEPLLPWAEACARPGDGRPATELAADLAASREAALLPWGFHEAVLAKYVAGSAVRVLTPGGGGGEPLHVLSGLERRSARWDCDPEAARAALSAALSLVLRLVGRNPDPARSRDHVLLSMLAERRLVDGLRHGDGRSIDDVAATIPRLAPRWFVMRDAQAGDGVRLLQPRWAMSLLRGPMTRDELRRARSAQDASSLRLDMPPNRAGGST